METQQQEQHYCVQCGVALYTDEENERGICQACDGMSAVASSEEEASGDNNNNNSSPEIFYNDDIRSVDAVLNPSRKGRFADLLPEVEPEYEEEEDDGYRQMTEQELFEHINSED